MSGYDRVWIRQHLEETLGHWLQFAPTATGFFRCDPDRKWQSRGEGFATLVSQSRLVFNFAMGVKMAEEGKISRPDPGEMETAGRNGLEFLLRAFRDRQFGGWVWSVTPEGSLLEDHKDAYGHAFVLLALAWGGRYLSYEALADEAAEASEWTWGVMKDKLADGRGGFRRYMDRTFQEDRDEARSQNPVMHLFEALLAQRDLFGREWAAGAAADVRKFVLDNLFEPVVGCIPEFYNMDWKPLSPAEGGRIDLGHQFEWAFLLTEHEEGGTIPPEAHMLARFGLVNGFDQDTGGVRPDYGSDDYEPYVWWTQAEALRALVRLQRYSRDSKRLEEAVFPLANFIALNFVDGEYGGWFGSVRRDGEALGKGKGSPTKVDYHVVGMCAELLEG